MGNTLAQLGSALALGVALAGAPNTASAQSTQVAEQTQGKVEILLAQAGVEKQEFVVYVRQVDANGNLTEKTVEVRYTKNERGVIVPPDTKWGKLLDGRDSTGDAVRDRATNRQIIGQYDKDKQIVLAMTDKNDIVGDAERKIKEITTKVNNKAPITSTDIFNWYYASYIFGQGVKDAEISKIEFFNKLAKSIWMNSSEMESLKQKAKDEAVKRWQSVTRSLG